MNEYFDNSYFNEIFAAYLFLPLRAPEDATVKNCFWKHEYLSCVKLSNDKVKRKCIHVLTFFSGIIIRKIGTFTHVHIIFRSQYH